MPYPDHFRITWSGNIQGTPETFSFGVHANGEGTLDPDADVNDINLDDIADATQTFIGGGLGVADNRVKITKIAAYKIGSLGRMVGNPKILDLEGTPLSGSAAPTYPTQIAWCVTLVGPNRGPARFGRFFLPCPNIAIAAADSRITEANVTAAVPSIVTWLKAVADSIDIPLTLQSAEIVNVSPKGDGVTQVVDHVEVGRVLDTLRSRRRALEEARLASGHIDW